MKTDMTFTEICDLLEVAVTVPRENIYSAVPTLRNGLVRNFVTPARQQVLIASPALPSKVQDLFAGEAADAPPENVPRPSGEDSPNQKVGRRIVTLNGGAKKALIAMTFRIVRMAGIFIK